MHDSAVYPLTNVDIFLSGCNKQNIYRYFCHRFFFFTALPDLEPSIYMLETTTFLQDRHLYYLQCAMEEKCLAPSAYEAQRSRGT